MAGRALLPMTKSGQLSARFRRRSVCTTALGPPGCSLARSSRWLSASAIEPGAKYCCVRATLVGQRASESVCAHRALLGELAGQLAKLAGWKVGQIVCPARAQFGQRTSERQSPGQSRALSAQVLLGRRVSFGPSEKKKKRKKRKRRAEGGPKERPVLCARATARPTRQTLGGRAQTAHDAPNTRARQGAN